MVLLSVDPSVLNLGWAAFNPALGPRGEIAGDGWKFGVIHPRGETRTEKWNDALCKLHRAFGDWPVSHFVAEWPMYFGSEKGRIAAQKGHTLELAGMVGYLAGRLCMGPGRIKLYTPAQWKGSVPKLATQAKFIRTFGPAARSVAAAVPDDTVDAIMIATHWLNEYKSEDDD